MGNHRKFNYAALSWIVRDESWHRIFKFGMPAAPALALPIQRSMVRFSTWSDRGVCSEHQIPFYITLTRLESLAVCYIPLTPDQGSSGKRRCSLKPPAGFDVRQKLNGVFSRP
jgi:hypothetical protein